jgi:predicted nucleic-acid-binding protein
MIVGDIPAQEAAARNLIESSSGVFSVADLVFIEIEYALRQHYGVNREQVTEIINTFIVHPKINCNKQMLIQALSVYQTHPALSLTDICLAIYANLNNATPLWTFDKKLSLQLKGTRLVK